MSKIYTTHKIQKPRDIAIVAALVDGVKLTPLESFRHSQNANSIG